MGSRHCMQQLKALCHNPDLSNSSLKASTSALMWVAGWMEQFWILLDSEIVFWYNWHCVRHLPSLVNLSTTQKGTVDTSHHSFALCDFMVHFHLKSENSAASCIIHSEVFLGHGQDVVSYCTCRISCYAVFQVPGLSTMSYWAEQCLGI